MQLSKDALTTHSAPGIEDDDQADSFTKLYNILVQLTFEKKNLAKEQQENERNLLELVRSTEAKERELTMDQKNLERTLEQLQDLKIKNQLMQKQNEEIEGRIEERKKEQKNVLENSVHDIVERID